MEREKESQLLVKHRRQKGEKQGRSVRVQRRQIKTDLEMHKLTDSHMKEEESIKENSKRAISMHLYTHTHTVLSLCACNDVCKSVLCCLLDGILELE